MTGAGSFNLKPGQWTDDTSMLLCLAESLIAKNAFDPADQMARYLNWWQSGYLRSTSTCFDIGMTVREVGGRYLYSYTISALAISKAGIRSAIYM